MARQRAITVPLMPSADGRPAEMHKLARWLRCVLLHRRHYVYSPPYPYLFWRECPRCERRWTVYDTPHTPASASVDQDTR